MKRKIIGDVITAIGAVSTLGTMFWLINVAAAGTPSNFINLYGGQAIMEDAVGSTITNLVAKPWKLLIIIFGSILLSYAGAKIAGDDY